MITLEEEKSTWKSFMLKEMGVPAFMTLSHFNINILHVLRTVELYSILPKKLDEGLIQHSMSESQLNIIKQFIILDSLSRVMASIESALILFYALPQGYKKLVEILTRYEMTMVDSSIHNIRNRSYNMKKIIGLPSIKLLGLSKNEQKVLHDKYKKTCDACYSAVEKWIDFYEKYKIIYGKSRHGLTIWPDMKFPGIQTTDSINNSFVIAFDRRKKILCHLILYLLKKLNLRIIGITQSVFLGYRQLCILIYQV